MALVTFKVFDNSFHTHLLRVNLENEGIVCYIFDEHTVSMNPLFNVTVGGIKLKINEADVDRANGIVAEINKLMLETEDGEVLHCPNCYSQDIIRGFKSMKDAKGILSIIISLIFVVYPIYYNVVDKCKDCNHEF
jgi:hypothetical protein